ncbi:hypothetical protein EON65_19505 [archaeon]|nr:MAG: hypothetical protein EON65_19505 [archaeon]
MIDGGDIESRILDTQICPHSISHIIVIRFLPITVADRYTFAMNSLFLIVFVALIAVAGAFRTSTRIGHSSIVSRKFLFGSPEPPKNNAPAKKDGGLFSGMGNMMETMKKAQEIAKQAEILNKELAETVISGQDPTGQAVAQFTGLGVPVGVKLSDGLIAQGAEAASVAASQAVIDVHTKVQTIMVQRMQQIYGQSGMPLPQK